MSERRDSSKIGREAARDPGRSVERIRQERAQRRAARQESWLEQLRRIQEQANGKPESRDHDDGD